MYSYSKVMDVFIISVSQSYSHRICLSRIEKNEASIEFFFTLLFFSLRLMYKLEGNHMQTNLEQNRVSIVHTFISCIISVICTYLFCLASSLKLVIFDGIPGRVPTGEKFRIVYSDRSY